MKIFLLEAAVENTPFVTNWQKPQQPQLFIAPGNAGTAAFGTNLAVLPTDFEGLKQAAITHQIELVIVGPEVLGGGSG